MQNILKYIKESLNTCYDETEANSIARHVMETVTSLPLSTILTDKSKQITEEQRSSIEKIITRLKKFEPLQYVLGHSEFYGLSFNVAEGVLIPRPETEELVDLIIQDYKDKKPTILDIGTGSGCIAIALAKNLSEAKVEAWDVSEKALEIAQKNALHNQTAVDFRLIDVLKAVSTDTKFNIIVSNPPYVLDSEKGSMEVNVLDYEPHLALFVPDNQALMFYERIADLTRNILSPDGHLYFEINSAKGEETVAMLENKGFSEIELIKDLSGKDRIVKAKHPI